MALQNLGEEINLFLPHRFTVCILCLRGCVFSSDRSRLSITNIRWWDTLKQGAEFHPSEMKKTRHQQPNCCMLQKENNYFVYSINIHSDILGKAS